MLVIVDTNIFIKALFFKNEWCLDLLKYQHEGTINFIFNLPMIHELAGTVFLQLKRNGASDKNIFKASDKIQTIIFRSEKSFYTLKAEICKVDPSDNKFIDCAIERKCEYIITEDSHISSDYIPIIKERYNHELKILSAYQFITQVILQTRFKFGKF
jgi:putative PIN family toxin of toxin-antitoxin system